MPLPHPISDPNPYLAFAQSFARLLEGGRELPLGGFLPIRQPVPSATAPVAMVFAPHPDDECIVGALPLRLRRELGHRIVAVAVTQGSRPDRQEARLGEMREACAYLGFELEATCEGGLKGLHPDRRNPVDMTWEAAVAIIAGLLERHRPSMVFVPHAEDRNSTHQGTHALVMEALQLLGDGVPCRLMETEFWSPMPDPNVMVESSLEDAAFLVAATSFHRGEVRRNPYHLRLLSWMSDNVRRGGELLGGQGGTAPDYHFATLYRRGFWDGGMLRREADVDMLAAGTTLAAWLGRPHPKGR